MPLRTLIVSVIAFAACGDDTSKPGDTQSGTDAFFPDGTVSQTDTSLSDTTVADSASEDTADSSVTETSTSDTTVTETTADTSLEDSAVDTSVVDTSVTETTVADTTTQPDTSGPTCFTLAPGHQRHLVVARPISEPDGDEVDRWEVLPLLSDGSLGKATDTFEMARAGYGHVSFSADGALGAVAADDGVIGVFALDAAGRATVIQHSLDLGVYADSVQIIGNQLFIVDSNWQNNGGGIYVSSFGCDGSVGAAHLLYATKNAVGVHVRADGKHLVATKEAVDTTFGALHLVSPKGAAFERLATVNPFDADAILSSLAVTHDGLFALVGDNQFFSATPNRVAVVSIATNTITGVDVLTPIEDPFDIIVSPMNDAALVVTGFADGVRVLDYDATRATPFIDMGEPEYVTARPQLPGDAVLVGGAHPNLVYVAENQAIRRFRFDGNGQVTDLGRTATAAEESFDLIAGALGMQP